MLSMRQEDFKCKLFVWQQSQFVSQGNVGVFFPGIRLRLASEDLQVSADAFASAGWLDDVVYKTWKRG